MRLIGLRILATLIGLRGVGNVFKSFGTGSGMVFFGRLLPPESLAAPAVGLVMIACAVGYWLRAGWAVPLGALYAIFATLNVLLFPFVEGLAEGIAPWMYAIYAIVGAGIPWAAVWLARRA